MRLYRIEINGRTVDWAGTQADAKKAAKEAEHPVPGESATWTEEEVPTDKPGLIAWLKANATLEGTPPGE